MKICLSGYWSIRNNCYVIKRAFNLYKGLNAGDEIMNLEITEIRKKDYKKAI